LDEALQHLSQANVALLNGLMDVLSALLQSPDTVSARVRLLPANRIPDIVRNCRAFSAEL
jgi:hypothetical protein